MLYKSDWLTICFKNFVLLGYWNVGPPTRGVMAGRVWVALRQRTGAGKAAIGRCMGRVREAAEMAGRQAHHSAFVKLELLRGLARDKGVGTTLEQRLGGSSMGSLPYYFLYFPAT